MRKSPVSSCEVVVSDDRKTVVYCVRLESGHAIQKKFDEYEKFYHKVSYILPESYSSPPKKKLLQAESKLQEKRRLWIIAVSQTLLLHHERSATEDIRDFYSLPHPDEQDDSYDLGSKEVKSARPGDFDFLTTIGKGSFGRVFQVRHKSTAKIYAMKVLQKDYIRKKNESNINHPFLVSLHFSFQTKDKLYFVLDHLNGGELFSHLQKEKHFSEARCRFYAADIASALGHLHKNNIVYRDLKPENLLLDKYGYIVLTDFGLCKEKMGEKDTTNTFCGTPEYLAPEIILKKPYDRTVDWWCLGSVLYEMLFGLPPFYSRDHNEMYDRIVNQPLRLKHSVSTASTDIITQLLNKDRTKRLGAKNDFKEISSHPFFLPIDWDKLLMREIRAPYIPKIRDEVDVTHISKDFTTAKFNQASLVPTNLAATHRDHDFPGFTYVEKAHIG